MRVYFALISFVSKLETSTAVHASPALLTGVQACKDKLLAYFDQLKKDSEYYYFATSKLAQLNALYPDAHPLRASDSFRPSLQRHRIQVTRGLGIDFVLKNLDQGLRYSIYWYM